MIRTDPRDGSIYIGGEYHSSTGLEPWRCPTLYKLDKEGNPIWTAWNWTGPIVGTDRYRLVSDSAVRQLQVAASGDLVVGGWSDGGNSCFLNQPYDLTIRRKASKFGDSTWGAGVLSVAHIMKLDSETMELQGGCTWLTYNPTENKPNSCRINSLNELSDGRVVFTGGSTFGLIESPDAWVEAWWTAYQRDPAQAKGLISPSSACFNELSYPRARVGDQVFAVQGDKVILTGKAKEREEHGLNVPTFAVNALNPNSGAANRWLLMLIDTRKMKTFLTFPSFASLFSQGTSLPEASDYTGLWELGGKQRRYAAALILRQDGNRYPNFFSGERKSGEITILSEADLLGDDFTLHSKGGIQCLFNRMAPKPGMELKVPGGTLGGNLKDGPLDATIEGFAGWKIIKDAKDPALVAKTIGFVNARRPRWKASRLSISMRSPLSGRCPPSAFLKAKT